MLQRLPQHPQDTRRSAKLAALLSLMQHKTFPSWPIREINGRVRVLAAELSRAQAAEDVRTQVAEFDDRLAAGEIHGPWQPSYGAIELCN